jgi:hypothetical protein
MTRVRFESTSEPWTEYTLEDGSVVRCRLMVIAAKRREGEFNEHGKPIYDLERCSRSCISTRRLSFAGRNMLARRRSSRR